MWWKHDLQETIYQKKEEQIIMWKRIPGRNLQRKKYQKQGTAEYIPDNSHRIEISSPFNTYIIEQQKVETEEIRGKTNYMSLSQRILNLPMEEKWMVEEIHQETDNDEFLNALNSGHATLVSDG